MLSNKTALVTGGSRGIGAATARRLATLGARIVVTGRAQDLLDALVQELRGLGVEASAIPADLTDADSIAELFARIAKAHKRLDIVVNSAGVLPPAQRLDRVSVEEWNTVLALDLTAPWLVSRHAKALMEDGGVIVNISSTAGHYPSVGLGPYNVAKAAVLMLTRSAALEWARDGIRVVGIAPGKIDTEMVQPIVQYVEERGLALNPLGRLGAPEEVAELVAYLVSDHASFMTGTTITFDGGEMVGTAGLGS